MARLAVRLVVGGLGLAGLGGCMGSKATWMYPHDNMETLSETREEHHQRVSQVLEKDRRAIAEDLDLLFQTDRPTRLSRWHSR